LPQDSRSNGGPMTASGHCCRTMSDSGDLRGVSERVFQYGDSVPASK
jgi:hypothetical protein